jgi:hypothetical protein
VITPTKTGTGFGKVRAGFPDPWAAPCSVTITNLTPGRLAACARLMFAASAKNLT